MCIYTITINALLVFLLPVVANHDNKCVPLGESITLSCPHEDQDVEKIMWTFNNKVLYADSFDPKDLGFANVNGYSNNSYNSYLYIKEIREQNAGEYKCLVNGTILQEIYVNVTDANNNTRWILFGESITLSCSNEDNDGQLAVWKFNDKILYAIAISPTELGFENVKGYNNNNGGSFLNITDIRFNNAGMYTCIVKGATQTEVHINVATIPQLTIQANHEVIDEVYLVESEEQVELECMALNSTLNISLFWTIETNTSVFIKQQKTRAVQTQETLVDYHTELHFIAEEDTNITCSIKHDLLHNYTCNETISVVITPNRTNLNVVTPTGYIFSDMKYVLVFSGGAVVALICVSTIVLCVARCKKKKKKKSESSTSPGYKRNSQELDDYDGGRRETFMIAEKISGRCEGGRISRDEVEVITCLSSGKVFEYWKAVCDGHSENEYIIARKITENAQMKDDYNFISIAKSLQELDEHPNIVNFLGCAIEKVPHFTYHEYVENVTLRDILLQNGNPPNDSLYSSTDKRDSVKLPHLIGFGRDIADGLAFLHTNKLCHPALMTRKILVDKRSCCKLFDIWPTDISSARLAKLKSDENPPTAWFPPESIFMDQYDSLSDVWSFGVLLWEMFSNGEVPYQYQGVKEVEDHIRQLDILPQPTDCPNKIFRIMTSTWNKVRESRPTMSKIKGQLKDIEKNALQTEQKNTIASNNYFTLESFGADYALPIKPNAIQEE